MPMGYGLEEASSTQVVAAYAAPPTRVEAYEEADPPGWLVAGEFHLPLDVDNARLDVVGLVSDEDLTLQVRLFDMHSVTAVAGAVANVTSLTPTRVLSSAANLTGNRRFQIQIRCYGGSGEDQFGSLQTATITD